jgi:hypothetical protein
MKSRFEDKPEPFTYRRRQDCWEVLIIVEGEFKGYVRCRTEEDAIAVANWRVFQHRWEYSHVYDELCDLSALEKTLAVLPEYGYDSRCYGYRQCRRLAERLQAV